MGVEWNVPIGSGVWHIGDTFDVMRTLPSASVDMIATDPPYGSTACKWDSVLPLAEMWAEYWRLLKPNGSIVMTASQPFTSVLIGSQLDNFRYCWVWNKVNKYTGALNANRMPLKRHEDIAVFYRKLPTYNKQYREGKPFKSVNTNGHGGYTQYGVGAERRFTENDGRHNPCSVLQIPADNKLELGLHPTQKPVALFEYLIRTYTDPGDTVLDNTAGSGTTAVAAEQSGRRWICIERDEEYSLKAMARLAQY